MEKYWEWFCSIPGIYRTQREVLLRCFHDPKQLWTASGEELGYLRGKGCSWIRRVEQYRKLCSPEKTVHDRKATGIQFISHMHPDYPSRLQPLPDKPYGLFWRGELPSDCVRTAAIVGARVCTRDGKEIARELAREIVLAGGSVISGGAYGIDGAAQWEALEAGGKSFSVFGCGPDVCYPSAHRSMFERMAGCGGLISEFPPGTQPLPVHFPMRNRIISGLADVVAVVEARKKSGSLITAEFALEQGKTVMAVPGRPYDDLSVGCNELIAQGAGVILSADTLVRSIFPDYEKRKKGQKDNIALAPAEKLVYSSLGLHAKSLWELEESTALSLTELSDSLLSLELKGLVKEVEMNFFIKVK